MSRLLTPDELTAAAAPANRARVGIAAELQAAGIEASLDAGAFFPQPLGVLIGLPSLIGGTLAARTFSVPVLVVSGDPLSSTLAVDRFYALADTVALAVRTLEYRTSTYRGSGNAEPLPAIELLAIVTVTETEGS